MISKRRTYAKKTDPGAGRAAGPVVDVGSFHGRDIHVHFGLDTVPASFRRRIKQFVDGYLGSERMPVAFGGRSTELNALNAWFQDPDAPSHLLVAAEAGRGKTALLVRWLEQLDDTIPLAFVPISIRYQTSRPAVFFQAFAARLAYLLEEPLPTATSDPAEFYKEKLAEYLEALEERGEPCLIVVDGLDEATGWQFDASFLPDCTGSCLRVLVSARILAGDQDETGWLRRLEWDDPDASVTAMRIPPLNPAGIADVLRQTDPQLAPFADDEDLVANLDRLTNGDPLLLTFYVADLRQWLKDGETGRPQLSESDAGFGPYFERWLKKQGGIYQDTGTSFDEQIVKAILAILACAIGPLPLRDLAALVERLTQEHHLIAKDTMVPLERFIVGDGNDLGYALGHPKLRNYIRDEYFGGSDNVDRAERVFVDWGRDKIAQLARGEIGAADMPHYLLQFHAQHLQVVGAEATAYRDLLSPTWRAAWEADRQGEGYLGLSNDVEIATHAMIDAIADTERTKQPVLWADIFAGALISSSIQSLSSGIPPALLAKALEHNALAVGSALHFAERRVAGARLRAIAAVAEALSDNRRRIVLEEAVASITTFATSVGQGMAIADLAPVLPEDLLAEVLEFALSLQSGDACGWAFRGLIPVCDASARNRMFDAAFERMSPTQIFEFVAVLDPHYYEDRKQDLLALARKGSNLHDRAFGFRNIADVLDFEHQQKLAGEALRSVHVTDHTHIQWDDVCNALSPLRADVRGPALAEIATLTAERYTEDVERRIELETDPEFGCDQGLSDEELRQRIEPDVRKHFAVSVVKLANAAEAHSAAAIFEMVQAVLDPTLAFQCCSKLALCATDASRQTYIDAALAVLDQGDATPIDYSYGTPKRETIERVEALATLARLTDGDLSDRLMYEAKELALILPVLDSARCLILLAEQDRADVVRSTLRQLSKDGFVKERQETLETLAPHLDESTVEEALRVATRVSTGNDLAPLIQILSEHLSEEETHRALTEAVSFAREDCLNCLTKLGPHLCEEDARVALDRLEKDDVKQSASRIEVMVLKSLSVEDRQAFMDAKMAEWQPFIRDRAGYFDPEPVLHHAPAMTQDQRHQILGLFLEHRPSRSEPVVAELLDKAYVDTHPDARDKIKAYLGQSSSLNVVHLSRTLRDIFAEDIQSVLPFGWEGVMGYYDLPRYFALGLDPDAAQLKQESETFAKKICQTVLEEDNGAWSEWQECTNAIRDLPPDVATRSADLICAYLCNAAQSDDAELSGYQRELLEREVSTVALHIGRYLSPDQLQALLEFDVGEYSQQLLLKSVLTVATGPVFESLLTLSPEAVIADLSSTELATALKSKTRAEALQIYALWRDKWPDVAQANLLPFLPFIDPEDIAGLAEHARSTVPQAYFGSLPHLLDFAPEDVVPQIIERAVDMLPEAADLRMLSPLVTAARGDALSQVLHMYVRNLASLSRKDIMEEVSTVSGALADAGLDGSADAIFDRVSTVLTHWQ